MNLENTSPVKNTADSENQALVKTNSKQHNSEADTLPASEHLNGTQQQFLLKFCRQLVSVIHACEQSETAEIEVGRRQIGSQQIKVKLMAQRKERK